VFSFRFPYLDLVRTLKSRQPLAKILGIALGAILGFVALIIILQIYEISVVDLVLPLLAFVLPLGFIFGRTIQIMWESFVVLFILQPWMKGDFITSSGQSLTVAEISLYTTEGYDVYGVFTTIPNQAALSGIVQNFGRSVPGRLRVYFRLAVEKPGSEAYIVKQLSDHMRN
jgi:small-conductance mechanosensitive channel